MSAIDSSHFFTSYESSKEQTKPAFEHTSKCYSVTALQDCITVRGPLSFPAVYLSTGIGNINILKAAQLHTRDLSLINLSKIYLGVNGPSSGPLCIKAERKMTLNIITVELWIGDVIFELCLFKGRIAEVARNTNFSKEAQNQAFFLEANITCQKLIFCGKAAYSKTLHKIFKSWLGNQFVEVSYKPEEDSSCHS